MLISVALVILLALIVGGLLQKIHLPALIGLLFIGIILGPHALNLLHPNLLAISSDLREFALIVILTRAGLSLDISDLKKVGRPALLMCFLPALVEILATAILAPLLLDFTLSQALLLGSIVAAVSPAVVVPRMLKLIQEDYGTEKKIPQIILAGASVDDVFVLVLFSAFIGLNQGESFSAGTLLQIPVAILLGLCGGILVGWLLTKVFTYFHLRDSIKVLILISCSFLLMALEDWLVDFVAFSGMLSVMAVSLTLFKLKPPVAKRLSVKFNKIWLVAEIFLFVLVGATVNVKFAFAAGFAPLLLILSISVFRMFGVFLSLLGTNLNRKERLFSMISYLPKATVQAAIGSIPLSLGLAQGEMMLTVAVLAILVTAPVGALGIDLLYKKLLIKS
ncbi:NhaP-type Na+/H+ or K+/H+ antiporter [Enterococcus sp. PF1-24]|uniref:cation:proton antiporter n=1 Tax=unclassified Enterococcus TaxID=2608891 RepID=UPI0024748BEA|nr:MULTISPECIES: cation:proton antiporter [unclassified Enterococcus]MDH6365378.1 NhaP-type Na+/H+ or K+/H+ antiporter [Enterococcus sp. PFB1-1]MDH6402479.1 NhaP-type Na+/H+ or K+/H+ antiporter [Enterococcus sp. PF1-24]